ncbi:hypothetical protein [Bradyrhizobium sp. 613_E4_N2_2]|uniref:hypothetical protein n=1 Tax=Bradyrhizobium sp. 613_E4_N2_2 TaxID=3240371 RepID=UPI003F8C7323
MIRLEIDKQQIDDLISTIKATDAEALKALRSTIRKMGQWLRTRAGRSIRAETGMNNKILGRRFRALKFKTKPDGGIGGVWIGLNPVDLGLLSPVQGMGGVAAGPMGKGRAYEHAFMGKRPGEITAKFKGGVFRRTSKKRLPIERLGYDIDDEGRKALESDVMELNEFENQFFRVFERELKWRTQTSK